MQTVGGIKGCRGSMLCKQWVGLRAARNRFYHIAQLNQLSKEYAMLAAISGLY